MVFNLRAYALHHTPGRTDPATLRISPRIQQGTENTRREGFKGRPLGTSEKETLEFSAENSDRAAEVLTIRMKPMPRLAGALPAG